MKLDIKSATFMMLIATLCITTLFVTVASVYSENGLEKFKVVFTVFSNVVTAFITYIYAKSKIKNIEGE